MVDMRIRPELCQRCRVARAALIYHEADGTESWICWECSKALAASLNRTSTPPENNTNGSSSR
jgi:hypothetical protein